MDIFKRNSAIVLGLFLMLNFGCQNKLVYSTKSIDNVSKQTTLVLYSSFKDVNRISILVKGYIDGDATILIKVNNSYKQEYAISKGNVELLIDCDWYEDECIVEYWPKGVISGELAIGYCFR